MEEEIEEETRTWYIWYISGEGNRHWYAKDMPASWEKWQVEQSIPMGGCGDDVSEIISVELYNVEP